MRLHISVRFGYFIEKALSITHPRYDTQLAIPSAGSPQKTTLDFKTFQDVRYEISVEACAPSSAEGQR